MTLLWSMSPEHVSLQEYVVEVLAELPLVEEAVAAAAVVADVPPAAALGDAA